MSINTIQKGSAQGLEYEFKFLNINVTKTRKLIKKMGGKYICLKCNFMCCYESNYKQHLTTSKHTLNTKIGKPAKIGKPVVKILECKECNQIFQTRSGLWRHMKKCDTNKYKQKLDVADDENTTVEQNNIENQDNVEYKSMFFDAMSQNKEIMELLKEQMKTMQEQSKTIHELVHKIDVVSTNSTIDREP